MKYVSLKRGFTLIELLVVIAIIGLLASTVLASLSGARETARDTTRLSQARELTKALEIYRAQKSGDYPCSTGTSTDCNAGGAGGNAYLVRPPSDATFVGVEAALRTVLKFQPVQDTQGYALMYNVRNASDPSAYTIMVGLENPISSPTASTTPVAVGSAPGITMNYCRIISGVVDETSKFGSSGGQFFKEIGRCPVSSIK